VDSQTSLLPFVLARLRTGFRAEFPIFADSKVDSGQTVESSINRMKFEGSYLWIAKVKAPSVDFRVGEIDVNRELTKIVVVILL
jgi:hypothetical protein